LFFIVFAPRNLRFLAIKLVEHIGLSRSDARAPGSIGPPLQATRSGSARRLTSKDLPSFTTVNNGCVPQECSGLR
jgi:hypothetical protein